MSVYSDILTNNFYSDILLKIVIGLLLTVLTSIINAFRIYYSSLHGKYRYVNILRSRFPRIDEFLYLIRRHNRNKQVFVLYYLFFGLVTGFILAAIGTLIFSYIFHFIFFSDYNRHISIINGLDTLNMVMFIPSSLNISVIFIAIVYFKWDKLVRLKHLSTPKIKKYSILEIVPIYVFMIYWIFIGVIFGANIIIYSLLCKIYMETSQSAEKFSLTLTFFSDMCNYFGEHVQYLIFHRFMYLCGMLLSLYLIANSYNQITLFNKDTLKSISNFYYCEFPYVKIKTNSGESKGQLRDILNKSLVTLNEKNILIIIPWDKIDTMEASQPKKNEYLVFDNDSVKDK